MKVVSLALLSTLCLSVAGCGDDEPGAAIACSGDGCVCGAVSTCVCSTDCTAACGDASCTVVCEPGLKCDANSTGPVDLTCGDGSECKGNGGDGSRITCNGSVKCELKSGAESVAVCAGDADCKFNLGPGSTVACNDTSQCDVKCTDDCTVTCAATASCAVSCGPEEDVGTPGITCPQGELVCGECPPGGS